MHCEHLCASRVWGEVFYCPDCNKFYRPWFGQMYCWDENNGWTKVEEK